MDRQRQHMTAVDHRFALGNRPAFSSAPVKKITRQRQLPKLGVQHHHIDRRFWRSGLHTGHIRRALLQPCPPVADEVRLHLILRRQLGERLLALYGSPCHLRLERRAVVPTRSLAHLAISSRPAWPLSDRQAERPALILGDQQRIETRLAVPQHRDRQAAGVHQHRLPAIAIARLAAAALADEVMVYLRVQRALGHRLFGASSKPPYCSAAAASRPPEAGPATHPVSGALCVGTFRVFSLLPSMPARTRNS